ncbi:hypothetical protein NUSPORA_00311 [Nucleospora cyclopteri]
MKLRICKKIKKRLIETSLISLLSKCCCKKKQIKKEIINSCNKSNDLENANSCFEVEKIFSKKLNILKNDHVNSEFLSEEKCERRSYNISEYPKNTKLKSNVLFINYDTDKKNNNKIEFKTFPQDTKINLYDKKEEHDILVDSNQVIEKTTKSIATQKFVFNIQENTKDKFLKECFKSSIKKDFNINIKNDVINQTIEKNSKSVSITDLYIHNQEYIVNELEPIHILPNYITNEIAPILKVPLLYQQTIYFDEQNLNNFVEPHIDILTSQRKKLFKKKL